MAEPLNIRLERRPQRVQGGAPAGAVFFAMALWSTCPALADACGAPCSVREVLARAQQPCPLACLASN